MKKLLLSILSAAFLAAAGYGCAHGPEAKPETPAAPAPAADAGAAAAPAPSETPAPAASPN